MVKTFPTVVSGYFEFKIDIDDDTLSKFSTALGKKLDQTDKKRIEASLKHCHSLHLSHLAAPNLTPVRNLLKKTEKCASELRKVLQPIIDRARSTSPLPTEFAVYSRLLSESHPDIDDLCDKVRILEEGAGAALIKISTSPRDGSADPSYPMLIRNMAEIAKSLGVLPVKTYNVEKEGYASPFFEFTYSVMQQLPKEMQLSPIALGKRIQRELPSDKASKKGHQSSQTDD